MRRVRAKGLNKNILSHCQKNPCTLKSIQFNYWLKNNYFIPDYWATLYLFKLKYKYNFSILEILVSDNFRIYPQLYDPVKTNCKNYNVVKIIIIQTATIYAGEFE